MPFVSGTALKGLLKGPLTAFYAAFKRSSSGLAKRVELELLIYGITETPLSILGARFSERLLQALAEVMPQGGFGEKSIGGHTFKIGLIDCIIMLSMLHCSMTVRRV